MTKLQMSAEAVFSKRDKTRLSSSFFFEKKQQENLSWYLVYSHWFLVNGKDNKMEKSKKPITNLWYGVTVKNANGNVHVVPLWIQSGHVNGLRRHRYKYGNRVIFNLLSDEFFFAEWVAGLVGNEINGA